MALDCCKIVCRHLRGAPRRCVSSYKSYIWKNFKFHIYPFRILNIILWCAVVWAMLGDDALPPVSGNNINCSLLIQNSSLDNDLLDASTEILEDTVLWQFYDAIDLKILTRNDSAIGSLQVSLLHKYSECVISNVRFLTVRGEFTDNIAEGNESSNFSSTVAVTQPSLNSLLYFREGHFFALIVLGIFSAVLGFLAKFVRLPPLVGMIIAGFILRNLPIVLIDMISPAWSSSLRNIALVIILIRGGLALSFKQLKRLKVVFVLLSVVPCVAEGVIIGIMTTFYLQLPWQWGFLTGFVVAAISPAIVVPSMLTLKEAGYGVSKGIPSLIIGAASFDVILSISIFGIFLGLAFSEGNVVLDVFRAPIQVILGFVYGIGFGIVLWFLPLKIKSVNQASLDRGRFSLLFSCSLFAIFGSRRVVVGGSTLAGAGPLGVLVLAFISGIKWTDDEKKRVSRIFYLLWQLAQPFLFGLIGAELDVRSLEPSVVGQAVLLLVVGLVFRLLITACLVLRNGFNFKENIFIALAWIPKATVQAAVGSIALDMALVTENSNLIVFGRMVLTIAVLAIFLTAPTGGIALVIFGPCLLAKEQPTNTPIQQRAKETAV